MAELSDFLPSRTSGYVAEYFDGNTVTQTTTTVTSSTGTIVNVADKGMVYIGIVSPTAVVTLTIDGVTLSGDRETLSRMIGQGGQDIFNTGKVSLNLAFKQSVSVGVSGLNSGSVTVTVTT